jgi:hypothetical protein
MSIPLIQQYRIGKYLLQQKISGRKRYPLVLMLEPLFQCNLACAGCGKIDYEKDILQRRMSVADALQAVMQEAGLQVLGNTGIQVPWPPVVVFYQLPVNIDELDVIGIQKRFGVSREIAETILQSRAAMTLR